MDRHHLCSLGLSSKALQPYVMEEFIHSHFLLVSGIFGTHETNTKKNTAHGKNTKPNKYEIDMNIIGMIGIFGINSMDAERESHPSGGSP